MADEGGDSVVSAELSESTTDWLDERAAARDVSREEFVRQLLAAYRTVEEENPDLATGAGLEELADRLDDVEADTEQKIKDVRDRVVQVKREVDAKAPADHDHPDLKEGIRSAGTAAEAAQSDLADLKRDLEALRETTERGFDNYEEVLEYLTETTDDLEEKLTRVATGLVGTRHAVGELTAAEEERRTVDDIKREANRKGVTAGDCENCRETVDVGLLADPVCPHCESPVRGVEPKSGFFGSPTLLTGEPAAFEEPVIDTEGAVDTEEAVDALLEDDALPGLVGGEEDSAGDEAAGGEQPRAATDGNGPRGKDDV